MGQGDVLNYRKAESGTTNIAGARTIYAVEPLENTSSFSSGDSDAGILDFN